MLTYLILFTELANRACCHRTTAWPPPRPSHLLGHDNIVRVRLNKGEGDELYVRVHHTFEVELKKNLTVRIDPEYAFVFPFEEELKLTKMDKPELNEAQVSAAAAG